MNLWMCYDLQANFKTLSKLNHVMIVHLIKSDIAGNMESLQEGSELHERLQAFHREMYSAQYMTLAVQAEGQACSV